LRDGGIDLRVLQGFEGNFGQVVAGAAEETVMDGGDDSLLQLFGGELEMSGVGWLLGV
jgi:hypothetical protein